jgi:hypothetical protein
MAFAANQAKTKCQLTFTSSDSGPSICGTLQMDFFSAAEPGLLSAEDETVTLLA